MHEHDEESTVNPEFAAWQEKLAERTQVTRCPRCDRPLGPGAVCAHCAELDGLAEHPSRKH